MLSALATGSPSSRRLGEKISPVLLGVLLCFVAEDSLAASFDCQRAATEIEKAICADQGLSTLDEELGRAYERALAVSADRAGVRAEQRDWLKKRNDACGPRWKHPDADQTCLKASYEYRIWKLAAKRVETDPLRAGRYRVGWGWQEPLCRELAAHLNSHPEWPEPTCAMRVSSEQPDLSIPSWEVLDPRNHRAILKAIWDEAAGSRPLFGVEARDRLFEERFSANSFKLARATFDINNSGSPLAVYRAELGRCTPGEDNPSEPRLYAVDEQGERPRSNSFVALTSPPRDVFLYKGRAHLTWWSGHASQGTAQLGVYRTSAPGGGKFFAAEPVCTLSFKR